jgi:sodium/potassium-transporting ATPase subunit alpha
MTGLFNYLLWVGSGLAFLTYGIQTSKIDKSNLYLGIVLVGVILLTAVFSFYQNSKSAALMA